MKEQKMIPRPKRFTQHMQKSSESVFSSETSPQKDLDLLKLQTLMQKTVENITSTELSSSQKKNILISRKIQEKFTDITLAGKSPTAWDPDDVSLLLYAVQEVLSSLESQPPTPLFEMLAPDIAQLTSQADEITAKSSVKSHDITQPAKTASDQKARLFAELGIRTEKTTASPDNIDRFIANLSHMEASQRIDAAHTISDLYEKLPEEKQMHARINLILMTWRDEDPYARIAAIKALGKTGKQDVTEALRVALRDEEHIVRAAAARALGDIPDKAATAALVAAATRPDEHWSVQAAAIHAMGASGDRTFLNTVNYALANDDPSIRIAAIYALTKLKGWEAAPRLTIIAQRDKQPHVRHAAILALQSLGDASQDRHTSLALEDLEKNPEDRHT